jgi:O-antigen/teichoic acid export membrane protein
VTSRSLSGVASGAVFVFLGVGLSSGSKIIERIIVGRMLGPDAYGRVAMGLSVLMIGAYVGLMGFQEGVARFIPRYDSDRDIRGVWATGFLVTVTASVVVTAGLILTSGYLAELVYGSGEEQLILALMAVALPGFVMMRLGVGALRGISDARSRMLSFDIFFPIVRLSVLIGLLVVGVEVLSLPIAYAVSCLLGAVVVHAFLHRQIGLFGAKQFRFKEMAAYSAPLVMATVASRLLTRADTLMIGYLESAAAVGLYEAAYPLANGLVLILTAFGFLYLPLISQLDEDDDGAGVEQAYQITTKWVYIMTLPLFVTLVLLPELVIGIVFSQEYADAAPILVVLSIGFFTNSAFGRSRETLSALGDTTITMFVNLASFVVNIVLNILLIPTYGVIGAALASVLSFLALNSTIVLVLKWKYSITPFSKETIKTITLLPLTALPVSIGVRNALGRNVVSLAAVPVTAMSVAFVALLISGALESEDLIAVDIVEDKIGRQIPFIRQFIPIES